MNSEKEDDEDRESRDEENDKAKTIKLLIVFSLNTTYSP